MTESENSPGTSTASFYSTASRSAVPPQASTSANNSITLIARLASRHIDCSGVRTGGVGSTGGSVEECWCHTHRGENRGAGYSTPLVHIEALERIPGAVAEVVG